MSESSVQRHIKHLLKVGLLKHKVKGRGRYLSAIPVKLTRMNDVKLTATPVNLTIDPCQLDMNDPCQSDMLPKLDNRGYIPKLNNRETSSSKLVSTGLEFYKDVSLVKDNPELAKVSNADDEAREAHEKAEYLRIKKELLSKAKSEPVDYSDLPD